MLISLPKISHFDNAHGFSRQNSIWIVYGNLGMFKMGLKSAMRRPRNFDTSCHLKHLPGAWLARK